MKFLAPVAIAVAAWLLLSGVDKEGGTSDATTAASWELPESEVDALCTVTAATYCKCLRGCASDCGVACDRGHIVAFDVPHSLDLSRAGHRLNDSVAQLPLLASLAASGLHLRELPAVLGSLTQLSRLEANFNELRALPDEISALHATLREVELVRNQLDAFPQPLLALHGLRKLLVGFNGLTALPDDVGEALPELRHFGVNNNKLRTLPDSLGSLHNLEYLYAYSNNLRTLPDTLGGLASLRLFSLHNNHRIELPDSLGNLPALTCLNVRNCHLHKMPPALANVTTITELLLGDNVLRSLPKEYGSLVAITNLDLNSNSFFELPEFVRNFKNLEILNIGHNVIGSLPPWLDELTHLRKLALNGNMLDCAAQTLPLAKEACDPDKQKPCSLFDETPVACDALPACKFDEDAKKCVRN